MKKLTKSQQHGYIAHTLKYRAYLHRDTDTEICLERIAIAQQGYWNALVAAKAQNIAEYRSIVQADERCAKLQEQIAERKQYKSTLTARIKAIKANTYRQQHGMRGDAVEPRAPLIEARNRTEAEIKILNGQLNAAKQEIPPGSLEESKERFKEACRAVTQEYRAKLPWTHEAVIYERFWASLVNRSSRAPKLREGDPETISLYFGPNAVNDQGKPLGKGWTQKELLGGQCPHLRVLNTSGRGKKTRWLIEYAIHQLPEGERKKGTRSSTMTLTLDVVIHRPLPPSAYIKAITLHGAKTINGWRWHLLLTTATHPVDLSTSQAPRTAAAGIDLGWRKLPIGSGAHEIRTAYLCGTDGHREEFKLPAELIRESVRINHLKSSRDANIEATRERLRAHLGDGEIAEEIGKWRRGLHKMGARGLRVGLRLAHIYNDMVMVQILESWEHDYLIYQRRIKAAWKAYLPRRRQYYRTLAKRICQRYDTVYVEDLRGDQMAKSKIGGEARTAASPFAALRDIRGVARSYQTAVVPVNAYRTSKDCHFCGAPVTAETAGHLEQICMQGHHFDRDENAASNILARGLELTVAQALLDGEKSQQAHVYMTRREYLNARCEAVDWRGSRVERSALAVVAA